MKLATERFTLRIYYGLQNTRQSHPKATATGDLAVETVRPGGCAPRPLLVEAGTHDPIFPIAAVRSSLTKTRRVYDVFSTRHRVGADVFSGRHQISGARAYDFLREALV